MKVKLFILILLASCLTIIAYADNYDTARKVQEMSREVDSYQKARANGTTFGDYSETPTWVSVLWGAVGLALTGLLGLALWSGMASVAQKTRRTLLISIATVVAVIGGIVALKMYETQQRHDAYNAKKSAETQSINDAIKAYKTVFKEHSEPIKQLFDGDDPRFLAGDKSFDQILRIPGARNDEVISTKYSMIKCASLTPCDSKIFPEHHPLTEGLWDVGFYFCKNKEGENILTGFAFSFNDYYRFEQYTAAVAGLLDAGIIGKPYVTVGKQRRATYFDSTLRFSDFNEKEITRGNGLSIIWSKMTGQGVDMCDNKSLARLSF